MSKGREKGKRREKDVRKTTELMGHAKSSALFVVVPAKLISKQPFSS